MIATQYNLDSLADRIERAYKRRHPHWLATGLTPGAWTAAAIRLHEVVAAHPTLPIDPELFVAVQEYRSFRRDPWAELTQEGAAKRYRHSIRRIVRQLKKELALEICWSTRYLDASGSIDELLTLEKSKISPIVKLMLCQKHDRPDLTAIYRPAAEAQHLACPLYRMACKHLVPPDLYPRTKPVISTSIASQEETYVWN